MSLRLRWVKTLGMAILMLGALASPAAAQGGGSLPAYGEPTIISSTGVQSVYAADFTRDGIPDVATVASTGLVTVRPGLGDGTFGAGVTSVMINGWSSPTWLGDFNGDGTPDLAFIQGSDFEGGTTPMGVILGNGNGTFQPYQVVGALPYETIPAVGDFDGDGRSDLAGAGIWGGFWGGQHSGIVFLWGRADGGVDRTELDLDLGTSRVGHTLFTADFNGDGKPDLVWKKYLQAKFTVMPGQGNRTFGAPIDHTSAGEPTRFASADFNSDTMQDLAVIYSSGLGILRGNGDGTFQPVTSIGAYSGNQSNLHPSDLDGDGKVDLSVAAGEGIAVLVNNGDGSFRRYALTAGVTEPHSSDSPFDYALADFNRDGRPDFLVAWGDEKAGLYLGLAGISTSLTASAAASTVGQAVSLTATVTPAGLTGPVTFYDGASVLGSGTLAGGHAVFTTTTLSPGAHAFRAGYGGTLMNAPVTLSSPVNHAVGALPARTLRTSFDVNPGFLAYGLAAGDLNGDGRADLAASDWAYGNRIGVLLGNGDGTLQDPLYSIDIPPGTSPRFTPSWLRIGDANQDGLADVGLTNDEGGAAVWLGNGDGTIVVSPGSPRVARFADVNRDGKVDGVVGGGDLEVWLGLGDRKGSTLYFPSFSLAVTSRYSEITFGDFNGDLNLDVAMTTEQENRVYVVLGNGDGTLQTPKVNTVGNGPTFPVVADFNGDGKADLAFSNSGSGKVSVLLGKGDGDFLAPIDTTLGGTLTQLAAADLTGDGQTDLALLSTSEDRLLVLPGNGNGTFGVARRYYAGTVLVDLTVADFNVDGRMDLAVSSNEDLIRWGPAHINVLLGVNPAPTAVVLNATPTAATLSQPVTMTAAVSPPVATGWVTFNDGGTPLGSVAVSGGQATFQTRLLGSGVHQLAAVFSGDGTLYDASASAPVTVRVAALDVVEFAPSVGLSASPAKLAAQADFNGDGIVDLVVAGDGPAMVLLGQGDGQFTARDLFITFYRPTNVLPADFNRDGKIDVAAGSSILFGNGDGTFGAAQTIAGADSVVLAADVNGDGAPDLVDTNGRVFLNRGAGTFASPIQLSLGLTVSFWQAVAGDLNADGLADLVVPDMSHGYVYVLLAAGDGAFLSAVPYSTVGGPRAAVIADLNGDGVPDLAIGGGDRIGIMLGLGPGTFENWGDVLTGLRDLRGGLYTCDCDGDGKADLLAYNTDEPHPMLLRGVGDGTFEAAVEYGSVSGALWLMLTDLNHDGSPDLVYNSWVGGTPISVSMAVVRTSVGLKATPSPAALSGEVTLAAAVTPSDATGTITFYDDAVILGKAAITGGHAVLTTKWLGAGVHALRAYYSGDPLRYASSVSPGFSLTVAAGRSGGFGAGTTFATSRGPKSLATGDLNGDGKQDLVVVNATSNTISVLLGDGAGGFAPRVSYNTGSAPQAVLVADLNGDAKPDVAVANSGSKNLSILQGNGNGTLQPAVNIVVTSIYGDVVSPQAIAAADVNGDQATEVVVGTSYGAYALGTVVGTPTRTTLLPWYSVTGILAVDLNADLLADVFALDGLALLQDASGSFSQVSVSLGATPSGLAAGDFNGDGTVDLATANTGSNAVSVLLGNGNGTFQSAVAHATGNGPVALVSTDGDGDGLLDLVVANGGGNTLTLLLGHGDGTFIAGGTLATGSAPAGVVAGDFNADGVVDLAVTNGASDTVSVFLGQAAPPTEGPRGDFTGDLKSDVLWRHASGGDLWLWPMNGPARTAESYVRTVSDTNWEIRAIADFDGDGKADLFWRNKTTGQLYFWPMDGASPQGETYAGTVDTAYDIVGSGDFDGNGKADLLWRHTTLGEVWIWLMDGATALDEVFIDRVDPAYVVKGVADLDANGQADIVWHGAAGDVWVWPMNGTTRLDQVWVGTVPDTEYQIEGVADFDGNGKADLVWWHATRGEVWVWTMNGTTREAETWVGTVPDTTYQIAGTGDYNGDTKADLLWRNVVNGEVWVWLMNGPIRLSEAWVATVADVGYRIVK